MTIHLVGASRQEKERKRERKERKRVKGRHVHYYTLFNCQEVGLIEHQISTRHYYSLNYYDSY